MKMIGFKDFKIRNQINIIVCVAAALLLLMLAAVYITFDGLVTQQAVARFDELSQRSGDNIRLMLRSIEINNRNFAQKINQTATNKTVEANDAARIATDAYVSMNSLYGSIMGVAWVFPSQTRITAGLSPDIAAVVDSLEASLRLEGSQPKESQYTPPIQLPNGQWCFACITPVTEKGQTTGWLVSLFDDSAIRRIIWTFSEGDDRNTAILLSGKNLLTATRELDDKDIATVNTALSNPQSQQKIRFQGNKSLLLISEVTETDWTLGAIIPQSVIKEPIWSLVPYGVLIFLASVAILAVASVATIRAITRPVEDIVRSMDKIRSTQHYEEIHTPLHNEVSVIASHFNRMMRKIADSDRQLYEAEKKMLALDLSKVQAELSFYQSQINPHFLYNTLESIRSMALVYGVEEIEKIALSTAKVFRYAVKAGNMVTLADELDCTREYLNIMCLRFPERYSFEMDVPEMMMGMPMLKMTLQPVVENCFKHGFDETIDQGLIRITASMHHDSYCITVEDNGKGMDTEMMKRLETYFSQGLSVENTENSETAVGLINTHSRLKLAFGDAAGLSAAACTPHGLRISLHLQVNRTVDDAT